MFLLVACEDLHFIRKFGNKGRGGGEFESPEHVAFANGELYVSDYGKPSHFKFLITRS